MVTYVLDASALLRLLLGEPGAQRVKEVLGAARDGSAAIIMSAVTWGEVFGKVQKAQGRSAAEELQHRLARYGLTIVPATAERAARAAGIKIDRKIPYADSFCVELTADSPTYILLTADFDFVPAEQDVRIEFLPPKPVN